MKEESIWFYMLKYLKKQKIYLKYKLYQQCKIKCRYGKFYLIEIFV
jgi:hypothetical protein